MLSVLAFIAVLAVLVLVHEFGHFIAARIFKVKVDEFGVGFPPRIWGIKRGHTLYSINWVPLGGFVKIKGESGEHRDDKDSFAHRRSWQKAIILLAGVLMNVALAWVLLSVGFGMGLPSVLDGVDARARVRDQKIEVVEVLKGGPAETAGIKQGDAIIWVDAIEVKKVEFLRQYLAGVQGAPVTVSVMREGEREDFTVAPVILSETGKVGIGVALLETGIVSYAPHIAVMRGAQATAGGLWEIVRAFGTVVGDLFSARPVSVDLSGPVGIAVVTGKVARLGFLHLLQFTALLSLNLAIVNVIPFPALDGGRLFFLGIEKLLGKPLRPRFAQAAHMIGFAILLLLVLLVTYRDILRFDVFRNLLG